MITAPTAIKIPEPIKELVIQLSTNSWLRTLLTHRSLIALSLPVIPRVNTPQKGSIMHNPRQFLDAKKCLITSGNIVILVL
jgi:hypothetical protein